MNTMYAPARRPSVPHAQSVVCECMVSEPVTPRRLVKAVAFDPDRDLSLEEARLVDVELLVDVNNEGVWHELDLKAKLAEHNAKREAKELKPITFNNLVREVYTIQTF